MPADSRGALKAFVLDFLEKNGFRSTANAMRAESNYSAAHRIPPLPVDMPDAAFLAEWFGVFWDVWRFDTATAASRAHLHRPQQRPPPAAGSPSAAALASAAAAAAAAAAGANNNNSNSNNAANPNHHTPFWPTPSGSPGAVPAGSVAAAAAAAAAGASDTGGGVVDGAGGSGSGVNGGGAGSGVGSAGAPAGTDATATAAAAAAAVAAAAASASTSAAAVTAGRPASASGNIVGGPSAGVAPAADPTLSAVAAPGLPSSLGPGGPGRPAGASRPSLTVQEKARNALEHQHQQQNRQQHQQQQQQQKWDDQAAGSDADARPGSGHPGQRRPNSATVDDAEPLLSQQPHHHQQIAQQLEARRLRQRVQQQQQMQQIQMQQHLQMRHSQARTQVQAQPHAQGQTQTQAQVQGQAQVQAQAQAQAQTEAQAHAQAQVQAQVQAQFHPQAQAHAHAQVQAHAQAQATRAQAQVQGQSRVQSKRQSQVQVQGNSQGQSQPDGQVHAQAQAQAAMALQGRADGVDAGAIQNELQDEASSPFASPTLGRRRPPPASAMLGPRASAGTARDGGDGLEFGGSQRPVPSRVYQQQAQRLVAQHTHLQDPRASAQVGAHGNSGAVSDSAGAFAALRGAQPTDGSMLRGGDPSLSGEIERPSAISRTGKRPRSRDGHDPLTAAELYAKSLRGGGSSLPPGTSAAAFAAYERQFDSQVGGVGNDEFFSRNSQLDTGSQGGGPASGRGFEIAEFDDGKAGGDSSRAGQPGLRRGQQQQPPGFDDSHASQGQMQGQMQRMRQQGGPEISGFAIGARARLSNERMAAADVSGADALYDVSGDQQTQALLRRQYGTQRQALSQQQQRRLLQQQQEQQQQHLQQRQRLQQLQRHSRIQPQTQNQQQTVQGVGAPDGSRNPELQRLQQSLGGQDRAGRGGGLDPLEEEDLASGIARNGASLEQRSRQRPSGVGHMPSACGDASLDDQSQHRRPQEQQASNNSERPSRATAGSPLEGVPNAAVRRLHAGPQKPGGRPPPQPQTPLSAPSMGLRDNGVESSQDPQMLLAKMNPLAGQVGSSSPVDNSELMDGDGRYGPVVRTKRMRLNGDDVDVRVLGDVYASGRDMSGLMEKHPVVGPPGGPSPDTSNVTSGPELPRDAVMMRRTPTGILYFHDNLFKTWPEGQCVAMPNNPAAAAAAALASGQGDEGGTETDGFGTGAGLAGRVDEAALLGRKDMGSGQISPLLTSGASEGVRSGRRDERESTRRTGENHSAGGVEKSVVVEGHEPDDQQAAMAARAMAMQRSSTDVVLAVNRIGQSLRAEANELGQAQGAPLGTAAIDDNRSVKSDRQGSNGGPSKSATTSQRSNASGTASPTRSTRRGRRRGGARGGAAVAGAKRGRRSQGGSAAGKDAKGTPAAGKASGGPLSATLKGGLPAPANGPSSSSGTPVPGMGQSQFDNAQATEASARGTIGQPASGVADTDTTSEVNRANTSERSNALVVPNGSGVVQGDRGASQAVGAVRSSDAAAGGVSTAPVPGENRRTPSGDASGSPEHEVDTGNAPSKGAQAIQRGTKMSLVDAAKTNFQQQQALTPQHDRIVTGKSAPASSQIAANLASGLRAGDLSGKPPAPDGGLLRTLSSRHPMQQDGSVGELPAVGQAGELDVGDRGAEWGQEERKGISRPGISAVDGRSRSLDSEFARNGGMDYAKGNDGVGVMDEDVTGKNDACLDANDGNIQDYCYGGEQLNVLGSLLDNMGGMNGMRTLNGSLELHNSLEPSGFDDDGVMLGSGDGVGRDFDV